MLQLFTNTLNTLNTEKTQVILISALGGKKSCGKEGNSG